MIDFIKVQYSDKNLLEQYLDNKEVFPEVFQRLEINSGEMQPQKQSKLFDTLIVVTQKNGRAYVMNSLHKLSNYLKKGQKQNYSDFSKSQIIEAIDNVKKGIPNISIAELTQLEFGFNIKLDKPAKEVIDGCVYMHLEEQGNVEKMNGRGYLKRFIHSNYEIKIYDKAFQFHLPWALIRFEIKIKSKRDLQKLGIICLEDLKSDLVLHRLYELLTKRLNEMVILDNFSKSKSIPKKVKDKLYDYTNQSFWADLRKEQYGRKLVTKEKVKFNKLVELYHLDDTKNFLKKSIKEKFIELLSK